MVLVKAKKEEEKQTEVKTETNIPQIPLPEIEEPDKFFERVLKPYVDMGIINKNFVEWEKYKIKVENALPDPAALQHDLTNLDSGLSGKKAGYLPFIIKIYTQELSAYLEKLKSNPTIAYQGISVSQNPTIPPPPHYNPYLHLYNPSYNPSYSYPIALSTIPSQNPDLLPTILQLFQKEQELAALKKEIEELKKGTKEDKYAEYIRELERERREELKQRISELEKRLEAGGLSKEDIKEIIDETFKEKEEKVTKKDLERVVEMLSKKIESRPLKSITPEQIELEKINKEYEFKMAELLQKKEQARSIADSIKEGIGLLGKAFIRTLIEEGGIEQHQAQTIERKNLMELLCPACKSKIIAPIDAEKVICPSCNKIWKVERPSSSQSKQKEEEEELPEQEEEEKEELPKALIKDVEGNLVCAFCGRKFSEKKEAIEHLKEHE